MNARELTEVITGATLDLIHEVAIERLHFSKDGSVSCTAGAKDGPICAPLLKYVVTAEGGLLLTHCGKEWESWSDVALRDGVLTANLGARAKSYRYTGRTSKTGRAP